MSNKTINRNFFDAKLGSVSVPVTRLGLSATYRPGKKTIYKALDEGINFFFSYGFDYQAISVLRDVMKSKRENFVVATGAYNLLYGHPNLRRTLEKRLRQLGTDYIDVFLFLGVLKPKHFGEREIEELYRFREEGKIGHVGISCHDRKYLGQLADTGTIDTLMLRYNAAHRGAEKDIFPFLQKHNPFVISYTATRWSYLTRRPKGYPKDGRIPTAGECYRFVLSNPNVNICLTAPSNEKHLIENVRAFREGPLSEEDMQFMKKFGDVVYGMKKWFM